MQSKVRECFARIGQDMSASRWVVVDASRSVEEVAGDCSKAALEAVKAVQESRLPVGKLFKD